MEKSLKRLSLIGNHFTASSNKILISKEKIEDSGKTYDEIIDYNSEIPVVILY